MKVKIAELVYDTDLDIGYMKNVSEHIEGSSFIVGCTKCKKLSGFKFDTKNTGLFGKTEIYVVCKSCGNREQMIRR